MKQYFTGFITAVCLTSSLFLFMGSQIIDEAEVIFLRDESDLFTGLGPGEIYLENPDGEVAIRIGINGNGGFIKTYNNEGKMTASIGSNKEMDGEIILKNKLGYNVVSLGAHRGDGFSGNGVLNINNQNGEYGWSVIGEVSPEHYK